MKPFISVILPCFQEPTTYLRASVESVLNQSYTNFELLIILDDPENLSLKDFLETYAKKDIRVKLIRNKKNLGLPGSLNEGIKAAKGSFIARLDADDISKPLRLEKQLAFLSQHPEVDLLFGWSKLIDEDGHTVGSFTPASLDGPSLSKQFFKQHLFSHPTLLCKAQVLKENLYDASQIWNEDLELWMRLLPSYVFAIQELEVIKYRVLSSDYISRVKKFKKYVYWTRIALAKHGNLYSKNMAYKKMSQKFFFLSLIALVPDKILLLGLKIKRGMYEKK